MKSITRRSLVCWGCGEFGQHGQTGKPEDVSYIEGVSQHPVLKDSVALAACGSSHTVVLTGDGELHAWGNGACGQLGNGQLSNTAEPARLQLDPRPPSGASVSGLACGSRHSMVLLTNGQVYAFGNNFYAQLGYDFRKETYKENQASPGLLRYLMHYHVTQVACGDKHTLFLFQDGTVSAVGHNSRGQIGDGGRHESVVPKPVDLEAAVVSIACGRDHNLVLTDSGDVYTWGFCKGCGHRRNDVLSPELKLQGRQVVQVAGGATHSLALTSDGIIFAWGFGSDGQLGLGERKLTSSSPRCIRHESLRHRVSFIGCGETYSAAITADGRLYMWGKNSHVIAVSHAPSKPFFYPVAVDQDERVGAVHSVHCGSWHALALTGHPDRQPTKSESLSDSESESERELTSGSSVHMSGSGSQTNQQTGEADRDPFPGVDSPIEKSIPPVGHQDAGSGSPVRSTSGSLGHTTLPKIFPPGMTGRGQTKLTIGEFYAMTDSSPSLHENGSRSSLSQDDDRENKTNGQVTAVTSSPPVVTIESPQDNKQSKAVGMELHVHVPPSEDQENIRVQPFPDGKPIKHRSAPASAKSSSGSSEVSESSLKKRMAENLNANNAFRTRESWGANHQVRSKPLLNKPGARSPSKPLPLASPSPIGMSPRSPNLIPRARSTEHPGATTIDRSHTMFISRTPAEQFILPRREPTFMACQSLALVDLNDLRAGSVFDHEDNGSHDQVQGQGHFQQHVGSGLAHGSRSASSVASRLEMSSSPTDCEAELNQVFRQRTPLMATYPHSYPQFLSASETPSAMSVTHQRTHELMGPGTVLGHNEPQVMFASPAPNLGRQISNPLLRRSRTMYGQANSRGAAKYYRKPGLPGAGYKPVTGPGPVRPLLRQTTSLEAIPKSQATNGDSEGPDLAILTSKQAASRSHLDHRTGKTGTDDAVSKRAVFSSATSWRTRNHTTLGLGKDSVPTIPLRKNAQLYLNGVGAKNGTKSDQNLAVTLQPLEKVEKQNSVSAKQGRKLVNFSDIQRDVAPKKKDHPVEIRTKSVKKYR